MAALRQLRPAGVGHLHDLGKTVPSPPFVCAFPIGQLLSVSSILDDYAACEPAWEAMLVGQEPDILVSFGQLPIHAGPP